jgi:RNA polymerase sigma factor (sigma-70 family)
VVPIQRVYLLMMMRPQAESPLIESSMRPPTGSFEEFFADRYEPLLRALYLVTGDIHEAEELAQEACFRVYERWERLRGTSNPAGYAYRVALNLRRSHLRRLATAARRTFRRDEPDAFQAVEERDRLRRALASIPERQREALVLLDWVGLSDRDAAAILRIRPEAVRMRASRARQQLRKRIEEGENDG